MHAVQQRLCPGLPHRSTDLRRAASYLFFDGIQSGDAFDRLGRRGRWMCEVDLVELAPRMIPTGDFVARAISVEMVEASIGIGLECALIALQVASVARP